MPAAFLGYEDVSGPCRRRCAIRRNTTPIGPKCATRNNDHARARGTVRGPHLQRSSWYPDKPAVATVSDASASNPRHRIMVSIDMVPTHSSAGPTAFADDLGREGRSVRHSNFDHRGGKIRGCVSTAHVRTTQIIIRARVRGKSGRRRTRIGRILRGYV